MEAAAILLLLAFSAVGAEIPYLNASETTGNCSDFNADVWMKSLPQPLLINAHQYELVPEAEEVLDYEEPPHIDDPDYDPLDSESTDEEDTEHLGEIYRRRRGIRNETFLDISVTLVSNNETRATSFSVEEDLEEVPLAQLRLKKYRNSKIVLPNQPSKVMLKNFQKSKMSFFLSITPQDVDACGLGSLSSSYYFQKLQGCWLEHKHKAHEICHRRHGRTHGGHGYHHHHHHHHHHHRHSENDTDHSDGEYSAADFHHEGNHSVSTIDVVNSNELDDIGSSEEKENEIDTEEEHGDHHGARGHHHHDHLRGRDHHHDRGYHHDHHHHARDHHHIRSHHHDRDHHHNRSHHHDRGHHHDRDHHHGRDHHHHDLPHDSHQLEGSNATVTPKRRHDFVAAEGEVEKCDNSLRGWMEQESKIVVEYATPECGCFTIKVHVSFPTDNGSTLVLTPDANAEYLEIYECVQSYSSEEESGEDYSDVNLDGIDPRNIIHDDDESNENPDKEHDDDDDDSSDDDDENDIDSDENNYRRHKYSRRRYHLRSRTNRVQDEDDDNDDDDDDSEEDDDEEEEAGRRSGRGRRSPEEEADQQAVDRREQRRRRRMENQRRRAERRRDRGRSPAAGDGEQAGDFAAANTVNTGETNVARQERRRLRQQRRQQRRQQQGGGNRRGRGRGNKRRGNTEDGAEDIEDVPLAQALQNDPNSTDTELRPRTHRGLRRLRSSARSANRRMLRSQVGFGSKFCCKQGIQHKKASFFPDDTGAREELACERVPEQVPMWGAHKHGVQEDACARLYTSCCQRYNLDQWKDWFISTPPDDDFMVPVTSPVLQ